MNLKYKPSKLPHPSLIITGSIKVLRQLPLVIKKLWKQAVKTWLLSPGIWGQTWQKGKTLIRVRSTSPVGISAPSKLPQWMHEQVDTELAFFKDGITPERIALAESFYAEEYHDHFARYAVQSGKLILLTSQQYFPDYILERFRTMTAVFETLAPSLPDLTFILYLGDGLDGWSHGCQAPVFTFSKRMDIDKSGLLIPDPLTLAMSRQLRQEVEAGMAEHP